MPKKHNEQLTPYDTADYLRSEEDIKIYLRVTMEESGDDPAALVQALGTVARARGMTDLAKKTGLTREGLYKALGTEGNPSFCTVHKVLMALGLRLSVTS